MHRSPRAHADAVTRALAEVRRPVRSRLAPRCVSSPYVGSATSGANVLAQLRVLAPRSLFSKHTTESVDATDHHHEPLSMHGAVRMATFRRAERDGSRRWGGRAMPGEDPLRGLFGDSDLLGDVACTGFRVTLRCRAARARGWSGR